MVAAKKKRKNVRRSVRPAAVPESKVPVLYESFERITSSRMRLKRDVARTFYALAHLLAEEHELAGNNLGKPSAADFSQFASKYQFHKHASSAYRMLADRLLKSFDLMRLVSSERYAGEEFEAALIRLATPGQKPAEIPSDLPDRGEAWEG